MNMTGFPSPAQGYEEETPDFNKILVRHPAATFMMRYTGKLLEEYHIEPGDLLVVDSSVTPEKGRLAVVQEDGEFRCRRLEEPVDFLFGIITAVVRLV
jgi:DNA polymerase V